MTSAMASLLERDGELARLHGWLLEAAAGHGRTAFVGGEAGIGKSALVGELARSVPASVRVAVGRCFRCDPHADVAAGTRAIVHDDLLLQRFGHLVCDQAGDGVGGAARRKRHDEPHRAGGILLRECRAGEG